MEVVVPLDISGSVTRPPVSGFSQKTAHRKKCENPRAATPPRASRKTNRPEPQTAKSKSPFQDGNGSKQPFLAFLEKS